MTAATLPPVVSPIEHVIAKARAAGRASLLESEGLELLRAVGIRTPNSTFVPMGGSVTGATLIGLATDRVVVKVVAASIAHKTDAGGVAFVTRSATAVRGAIERMATRLRGVAIAGFLVSELVEHEAGLGGELLVTLRWTADFGPIVAVGAGGIHAELLARDLRPGRELAIVGSNLIDGAEITEALRRSTVVRLATEPQRGQPANLPMVGLLALVERLLRVARETMPHDLVELEVNPMAVAEGELVALDVLARLGPGATAARDLGRPGRRPRPATAKIVRLLEPRSIAIVGVSSGENIGRTILRNVLRDGFDPAAVTIVKPGVTEIDGCRCVPDVASMPAPVDLFIVAVSAAAAAELIPEVIDRGAAASMIVIPGGFEETASGAGHAARIRAALEAARDRPGGGPVLNGGNCMGIRSRPGRYDTLFIPDSKLAAPSDHPAPLAIVAQSGAFAITRLSRLEGLDPKYVITVGNQLDLTIGDHLEHLAADPEVRVVGVYVEGFAPLDGLRFLNAARAIADRGGVVVLYRAGRTPAGASASASHTAAIAGDAVVTAALARQAGVVAAESLEAFDDLIGTFTRLDGRSFGGSQPHGPRLGAVTNAGFECVAIADTAEGLTIEPFDEATTRTLEGILESHRLRGVIEVHNPFDLTPMGDDAAFAEVAEAILASPSVEVGLIGNVPFTTLMRTLPADNLDAPDGVAARLVDLWHRTTKPWAAVVDAGPRYDPLAGRLLEAGIPTFRTADSAIRTLATVVATLCGRPARGPSGHAD